MAIIRWRNSGWDPLDEFDRLRTEINQLFDEPAFPVSQGIFERAVSPRLDLLESDDHFTVVCDLPGVEQKNLDISIAQGVLTIKGQKTANKELKESKIYKNECMLGSFQRTISLPTMVNSEKIEGIFKNGVLKLTLPKREESKAKKIELKS